MWEQTSMIEDDIPEIPGDSLERERLPDDAIAFIAEWAEYRTTRARRLDIIEDVAQEATARASQPKELTITKFYRNKDVGSELFRLAERRLLTIVNSSYDAISRRKQQSYLREDVGAIPGSLEDRPGPEEGFWLDVGEAFAFLTDEEVLVIEMRADDMSYPEIEAELRQINVGYDYTIDKIRGINERAQRKLRRYLRAYEPKQRRGQSRED